jgi:hypothetical protein
VPLQRLGQFDYAAYSWSPAAAVDLETASITQSGQLANLRFLRQVTGYPTRVAIGFVGNSVGLSQIAGTRIR